LGVADKTVKSANYSFESINGFSIKRRNHAE